MAISWLKTGAESKQLAEKHAVEQQQAKEEGGKLFRFYLKGKDEGRITFLDGNLSDEGFLLPPRFYEHFIQHNGKWQTFVCPEKTNPNSGEKCPLCEGGDKPSLVAAFTVIDHRTTYNKDKTKSFKDQKRLYVVKSQTFEMLNKLAVKRDGLVGCTFDVSRTGEKSPSAGDFFDFVEKKPLEEVQKLYQIEVEQDGKKVKQTYATPADYDSEIVYRTGAELAKLLGAPGSYGETTTTEASGGKNFESEL